MVEPLRKTYSKTRPYVVECHDHITKDFFAMKTTGITGVAGLETAQVTQSGRRFPRRRDKDGLPPSSPAIIFNGEKLW